MPHDPLAKHYHRLPPRERFALITKAADRGDEAQREELLNSAPRISRTMPAHFPHAVAFDEIGMLIFVELLEDAAKITEWIQLADDENLDGDDKTDAGRRDDEAENTPFMRSMRLASGASYILRAKVLGWHMFCDQLGMPAFHLWSPLPGFERLQRSIRFAENVAFTLEGMKAWLNRIRPAGQPSGELLTARDYAESLSGHFEKHVAYWNGRGT